jgi:hypothetical protein
LVSREFKSRRVELILRLFIFSHLAQIVAVDLGTIANVATAQTVLVGVVFGLVEMRRARRDREERAAFAAVRALMTPEWMSSSMIVYSIPKGTTAAQLENDPRLLEACLKIATDWPP